MIKQKEKGITRWYLSSTSSRYSCVLSRVSSPVISQSKAKNWQSCNACLMIGKLCWKFPLVICSNNSSVRKCRENPKRLS